MTRDGQGPQDHAQGHWEDPAHPRQKGYEAHGRENGTGRRRGTGRELPESLPVEHPGHTSSLPPREDQGDPLEAQRPGPLGLVRGTPGLGKGPGSQRRAVLAWATLRTNV